jgi:membrane-bound ClpP family serine protease
VAVIDMQPGDDGQIQVHGELWTASSSEVIHRGDGVRVLGASGLTLEVEKAR